MKIRASLLIIFSSNFLQLTAQQFYFPKDILQDSIRLTVWMPELAGNVIQKYKADNGEKYLDNLFRLQILADRFQSAVETINSLRNIQVKNNEPNAELFYQQQELYAKTKQQQEITPDTFSDAFRKIFKPFYSQLNDKDANYLYTAFISRNGIDDLKSQFEETLNSFKTKDSLNIDEAIQVCRSYQVFQLFKNVEPVARILLQEDDNNRYIINDSILIKTSEGATLSAIVVRKKNVTSPQPAALLFTIYADVDRNLLQAKQSAAYGYVGIVGYTRGKRLSPDSIVPYEHEAKDVNAVIDWIVKQLWSNGKVGMYGGSYSGFAQWAATKYLHPALKTIVPYVAAIPGYGLPMANNVFLNANYGWVFYTTNNKYLDNQTYFNNARWNSLQEKWYRSGAPYRKIDSIDGTLNKFLQRWLQHPSFDNYWQKMIPFKNEFAKINIPVLTITGYYDDGQISALYYLAEHYKYNKKAEHYLIIGPYDHFGAQRGGTPILRDYQVDPVAIINTIEITYQWLDYILKNGKKPGIVKDKINFEVMGANKWRHVASVEKMSNDTITFYLANTNLSKNFLLSNSKPLKPGFIEQHVDFADRKTNNNNDYYPYPIIKKSMDDSTALFFISEPLNETVEVNGFFTGLIKASINKKDMDFGLTLYEVMPDGNFFELSCMLGRASYAYDMTRRKLLTPGKIEHIPFEKTYMVSKKISVGSRLLVVLNINKNPFAQINYGTGKDVSDESIKDAKKPLQVKWYNDSYIKIPIWKD